MTNQHQQKSREPLSSLVVYNLSRWSIINPIFYTYFRGQVYGFEKVPLKGPLIIVSNHASYLDPPILACALGRPLAYMAKEELFKVPVLKQVIQVYGAYPVKRGTGDLAALRAALKALKNGWAVGIFLDGTRTTDGRIIHPKLGAAMIAAKAQVPLLPVSLSGTEKILRKGAVLPRPVALTIRVGELIEPPSSTQRDVLQTVTEKCATLINEMHRQG